MKKFKSLSFVVVGSLLLLAAGPLRPAFADCDGSTFVTKAMVAVSTTPASPTTLLATSAPGPVSCVQIMLHWSGAGTYPNSEFLLLSDSSSGFSTSATTGTIRIPAGQRPSDFLDLGQWRGPLYGVVIGTTSAQNVSVLRKK